MTITQNLARANIYFAVAFAVIIPLSVALTNVLDSLFLLSAGFIAFVNRDKRAFAHPISLAIFGLVTVYLLSSIDSLAGADDLRIALRKISRLLLFPLLLPYFAELKVRNLAWFGLLLVICVSVGMGWGNQGWSYFHDTIFTSMIVAFGAYLSLQLSVEYPVYRIALWGLAAVLTFYLFFVNVGRVGQLQFMALLVLFAISHKFSWSKFAGIILSLVVILSLAISLPTSFQYRFGKVVSELLAYKQGYNENNKMDHTSSTGARLMLATNSWELIKQRPLTGYGTGSYRRAYDKYAPEEFIDEKEERANPHNQYLLTWVETGLIGLIALLYFYYRASKCFWRMQSLEQRIGLGAMLLLITGCLANSWLLDFATCHFFVLVLALCSAPYLKAKAR